MSASYRLGIEVGRRTQALTAQVVRVRDRVWLALLDLDEWMEGRISTLEAELQEARCGAGDWRRSAEAAEAAEAEGGDG